MQTLGIDRLSLEERLALVQDIWDSIAIERLVPVLSDAHKAELDRRMADLDADPKSALTWEHIKSQITGNK
jgi:putative addiction module component (TIGR02574 family)